ncbi:MAG: NADH-quinone oxidoreductase subunit J [Verrucomicrobia subdivision 3 bacterium]|nr:NADH-quinone oxidoreductase subunit J [Limisphaerales bacterium]
MDAGFVVFAGLTVISASAAMSLRNLVHCALCLTVTFAGLAALYLKLNAQFVGLAQILVYIGAVAILIVFAILLTRSDEQTLRATILSPAWWVGVLVGVAVFCALAAAICSSALAKRPAVPPTPVTVENIGDKLMTTYILPLEVIGLLLTAAMIGAVIIAMQERRSR